MARWWPSADDASIDFRTESELRPIDLTERLRTLDACLRNTAPGDLSAEEARAVQGLLQTVHNLTLTPRG